MRSRAPALWFRQTLRCLAAACWLFSWGALPAWAEADCPAAEATPTVVADPATPFGTGLLWEVQADEAPPSFVYGTIHLADPLLAAPSAAALAALRQSSQFALEVLFDTETLLRVGASMRAAPGKGLGDAASPALLKRVLPLLATYGVDAAAARQLKPWAVWTTLSLPPSQASGGEPLDLRLLSLARAAGMRAFGLETLEEQVAVFDALSLQEQLALLEDAACHYGAQQAALAQAVAAWQREDLAWLLAQGQAGGSQAADALGRRLLDERNVTLAERLLPKLRAGGVFVAVGAAHLPGREGLLARFERAGLTVRRVR